MKKDFSYTGAMAELEMMAARIEDPSTGLDDIDALVKRSSELIADCREYLRSVRSKIEDK